MVPVFHLLRHANVNDLTAGQAVRDELRAALETLLDQSLGNDRRRPYPAPGSA